MKTIIKNIYCYLYNNKYFHKNIIYNINLFYFFFLICNEKKIGSSGAFNISENDIIKDESIFYNKEFLENYNYILDITNFNNILKLFLLSKRITIQEEYFIVFSYEVYSTLNNYINCLVIDNIFEFEKYYLLLKHILFDKKNEFKIIK